MEKPILISGIQPTGKLHLGNYLGALKNFVELQNSGKYECYFFIADYHSITEHFDPKEKSAQIMDLAATYLAAGLDPKKSTLFLQSDVPTTTELAWIFSSLAPFGELRRMTQFKEKANIKDNEDIEANVGLFTYPILMTSDIALYDANFVPVGDDQLQHLELTRTLIRKFNNRFGQTFPEPQPILTRATRLMSLDDPMRKMSKSRPDGCLFIDDTPEEIEAKLKRAVTDSESSVKYDPDKKPGVSNLLLIISELSGKSIEELEISFAGKNYSKLKNLTAKYISKYFKKFRTKKSKLLASPDKIKRYFSSGRKKAVVMATAKMASIKRTIGLTL